MPNSAFLQRYIIPWELVTINTACETNKGYFANSGGTINLALPPIARVGDVFNVGGYAGLYSVTQAAGQSIRFASLLSTTGAGGSITSTVVGDMLYMICTVADTEWQVASAIGVHNVV